MFWRASALALLIVALQRAHRCEALPIFASRYGVSCSQCHTIVPRLNAFGQAFMRAGFRAPQGMEQHGALPVALKINLAYSTDSGSLPKAIVDEVELLAGAPVGKRLSYRLEQYVVDGGFPGLTRDAWLRYTSRPNFGDDRAALRVTAGQFTLPLPVDPETQRDTINHYAIFDQMVGANPFRLFDDKLGIDAAYGREGRGLDVHIVPMRGRDPQFNLPAERIDLMEVIHAGSPSILVSAYRYDGTRHLASTTDRFSRQALAFNAELVDTEIDALAQAGRDSAALTDGTPAASAGGYLQVRRELGLNALFVARYDFATTTLGDRTRSLTTSLVVKPMRNGRVTIESVFGERRQFNAAWLTAF